MKITRQWNMPNADTFSIPVINDFVMNYLRQSKISIDPFARNSNLATYTNDMNIETSAKYHMKANEFLAKMLENNVKADLIIFDPPYSLRQIKECYDNFGDGFTQNDSQYAGKWVEEKYLCNEILKPGGYFLHFGWHTNGLGLQYNCKIREILLVAHGGAHNDTICMAEQKMVHQDRLI